MTSLEGYHAAAGANSRALYSWRRVLESRRQNLSMLARAWSTGLAPMKAWVSTLWMSVYLCDAYSSSFMER
jgi:hypothetical protein